MNEVLVWNRWIDCFHENNVIENDNVLIKRKPPFNIICDTLQNNFQDIKTLIDLLKSKYKGIDEVIIYNYITEPVSYTHLIMFESLIHVSQVTKNDCGIACIDMILKYYGYDENYTDIRKSLYITDKGLSIQNMVNYFHKRNIKTKLYKDVYKRQA